MTPAVTSPERGRSSTWYPGGTGSPGCHCDGCGGATGGAGAAVCARAVPDASSTSSVPAAIARMTTAYGEYVVLAWITSSTTYLMPEFAVTSSLPSTRSSTAVPVVAVNIPSSAFGTVTVPTESSTTQPT
jgi:hypothetical protein